MKKKLPLAESADKYECYQQSVQGPEHEVEVFDQVYRELFDRSPRSLREDFCGTFSVCCAWVKSNRDRTATGIDLDPEPINWGFANNLVKLKSHQRNRVHLLQQDVRQPSGAAVEVLAAQNFSFWVFKTRPELLHYFKCARNHLSDQGIMVLDMMGGGACFEEGHVDKRTIKKGKKGFKYLWKQARFNPITYDASFYISFAFADGSKLERAFEYHWRFWSIPEVIELLREAGFRDAVVYWEETDANGKETGNWVQKTIVASQPSWIAYVVGIR